MGPRLESVRARVFAPELDPVLDALWPGGVDLPAPGDLLELPPELFVFGGTGVDGRILALHVPTPEVRGALPSVVVTGWAGEPDLVAPLARGLRAVAAGEVGGDAAVRRRADLAADVADTLRSTPAPGYGRIQAADGLTVRFPATTWLPTDTRRWIPPDEAPGEMRRLAEAGRPGSALAVGRSALQLAVLDGDDAQRRALMESLQPVYRALGRDAFADLLVERLHA